jgi:hypothetical protein
LPGGIQNVNWSGTFSTNTPGVQINWQWAAAVYNNFTTNYNALNVKPSDDDHVTVVPVSPESFTAYSKPDHAGTPEAFIGPGILAAGATGGGGSNWTGGNSGNQTVNPASTNGSLVNTATLSASGVTPMQATATVTIQQIPMVVAGDFAQPGFWGSPTGPGLINALNGSSSATGLAQWLATSFPNLYGSGAGNHSLVNFTNSQVVAAYHNFGGADQKVLAAAISAYATSTNFAVVNLHSLDSHFNASVAGSGVDAYNIGPNGAAFGLANNSYATVLQLLQDLNAHTNAGGPLPAGADPVFGGIDSIGNVNNATLTSAGLAYTPSQIRTAYGITNLALDGTGQTIAIVDAYDDPNILPSLDAFDNQFGLTGSGPTLYQQYGPAPSFVSVLNQAGQTTALPPLDPTGSWETETALDVEWAHALAPGAKIVLVEANSPSLSDLMTAVATAGQQPGVSVVSMSWGFPEGSVLPNTEAYYDKSLATPGVTFVASTGDYGAADAEYPAFSPNVLAVGGTSLHLGANNSYSSETGWGYDASSLGAFVGSGGGASLYEAEPAYQLGVQSMGARTTPDVSFVADPATGAWIADGYNLPASNPWTVVGGTSLSAPSWAGLIALVNQGRAAAGAATLNSTSPTDAQQALYKLSASDFNSITSGSNGGYSAHAGYNLVTGLGTPVANALVPALVAYNQSGDTVTLASPLAAAGILPAASAAGGGSVNALVNFFNLGQGSASVQAAQDIPRANDAALTASPTAPVPLPAALANLNTSLASADLSATMSATANIEVASVSHLVIGINMTGSPGVVTFAAAQASSASAAVGTVLTIDGSPFAAARSQALTGLWTAWSQQTGAAAILPAPCGPALANTPALAASTNASTVAAALSTTSAQYADSLFAPLPESAPLTPDLADRFWQQDFATESDLLGSARADGAAAADGEAAGE